MNPLRNLEEAVYRMKLVPRGEVVPVQFLQIAKEWSAALALPTEEAIPEGHCSIFVHHSSPCAQQAQCLSTPATPEAAEQNHFAGDGNMVSTPGLEECGPQTEETK